MNELQKIEYQMLQAFIEVCKQLNLNYYLLCGSALGAVKYQGFIPWDDDIDVGMPREDYERFCENAQLFLPEYYFVQTYRTNIDFPCIYCKIRDSRTTYIEKSVSNLDIHHGVFIDVFPLDGYPIKKRDIYRLEMKKNRYKLQLACVYKMDSKQSFKAKLFFSFERFMGTHKRTQKIAGKLEKIISKWTIQTSEMICNHGNWQGKLEYSPKEHYGDGKMVIFEGLEVRIPENYDDYLTQKYGDWRAELPKEKQVGHHYYEICDLDRPYTEYIERIEKNRI